MEIDMQTMAQATKPIQFESVPVGGWFKDRVAGEWHLKTSQTTAMYQSWGTRHEPSFTKTETVFVE